MKRIIQVFLALLFILVSSVAPDSRVAVALDALAGDEPVELIDLLPESTLLAVEIRELSQRWPEIRAISAIRQFQDHVLAELGLSQADLLHLAGERAVLALVVSDDDPPVMPLVLLRPKHPDEAETVLGSALTIRRGSGALWVGPAEASDRLEALAARGDTERVRRRPFESGLVRGWIDPAALRALLRDRVEDAWPLVATALEAVRSMEFERDVTGNGVVTDLVIEIDPARLPSEVAQVFASSPEAWPVLPTPLPPGVLAASSFRIEADAQWAWLRHVAAGDSRGPLRNFDFWTDEFQARYERELERDLVEALGEHGWLFLVEGETNQTVQVVLLLEARDAALVEATLLDLRSWLVEQIPARTLGLVAPRPRESSVNQLEAHGLALWTPMAEFPGPAFLVTNDHLVLGTGNAALETGLNLLRTRKTWVPVRPDVGAGTRPPHESIRVSGSTLSDWIESVVEPGDRRGSASPWLDLLDGLEGVSVDVWYEDEAIRVASEVRFD